MGLLTGFYPWAWIFHPWGFPFAGDLVGPVRRLIPWGELGLIRTLGKKGLDFLIELIWAVNLFLVGAPFFSHFFGCAPTLGPLFKLFPGLTTGCWVSRNFKGFGPIYVFRFPGGGSSPGGDISSKKDGAANN